MKLIVKDTFIKDNFDKTMKLIDKLITSNRNSSVKKFFDTIGERYAIAPASAKTEYHLAFPGGLCFHNLHVYSWINKFASTMANGEFSDETLFLVSLFHDIGKLGDVNDDYYVQTDKRWMIEKGIPYEINSKISFMTVSSRGLFMLQHFGITLTQDEYLSILLHDGQYDESNGRYAMREPKLAYIIHWADLWATRLEKSFEITYE